MFFTFGMLVAGGLLLVVLSVPDLLATDWAQLPAIVWIYLGYISVFATTCSFFCCSLQHCGCRLPR